MNSGTLQLVCSPYRNGLLAIGGSAAAATILFICFPELDIAFSALFTDPAGNFHLGQHWLIRKTRALFNVLFAASCTLAAGGLAFVLLRGRPLAGKGLHHWLYLILCAAIGPGLVTNLVLKDHWGRARPVQLSEFGGDALFTPAWFLSDQCERNCSFVSGEASSIFILFFALAMVVPCHRGMLFLAGVLLGSAAGIVRIAAGGHFLSDVIFAGILMALVAMLLHRFLLERRADSGTL